MYLKELQTNPLRTKMLTSGSLAAAQEVLASWIAHDKTKNGHYFSSRVPKMAVYGAFISAPLGHVLISILQKVFAGRTSLKAKILQILVSNLIVCIPATQRLPQQNRLLTLGIAQVSPIQNTVYLTSMAIIAGARTFHQVRATVRAGFMPVMKVSWITSPLALAFAQKFLPEQTWVPFFNIIAFVIGTYINAHTKKKRLDALRKKVCVYVVEALMNMLTLFTSIMEMDEALQGGLMTIRDATTKILTYLRYRRLILALAVLC